MKTFDRMIMTLAFASLAALVLQGCAGTSGVKYEAGAAPGATIEHSGGSQPVVKADTKENFEAVAAAIHKEMGPGGRWQFVGKDQRATIDASFADMQSLFNKHDTVAEMDQDSKQRLFVDQQTVNAILTRDDGNRIVCRNEMPVGSHIPVKTCRTYAQIKLEQEASQKAMRDLDRTKGQVLGLPPAGSGH